MTNTCYQKCNSRYKSYQPSRLFCKKGCDSDQDKIQLCKTLTCNKLCIKQEQSSQSRLKFKFLVRAPTDPTNCLSACMQGCLVKQYEGDNGE